MFEKPINCVVCLFGNGVCKYMSLVGSGFFKSGPARVLSHLSRYFQYVYIVKGRTSVYLDIKDILFVTRATKLSKYI